MTRIILLGYMGAGKTTLGMALARQTGLPFYDLDWYIEERFHQTIPQLFEKYGEKGFREIEKEMLHEVAEFENVIISVGGGTPCFFDNMAYMNEQAQTVYLEATPEVLQQHLAMSKTERPLLKNKTQEEVCRFIADSLEQRKPYYEQARYRFNTSLLSDNEKIQDSVQKLRKLLNT